MSSNLFEFVTVGDAHLDKLENLFPANHLELQVAEIDKVYKYAIKKGVPNVVWLGDVAHKERLTEESRIALYSILTRYDGLVNTYIILGNHDVAREGFHSLQFFVKLYETGKFKSVHIFKAGTQLVLNKVPVNFLPYPLTKALPYDGPCDKTLNFAHLERPGAKRDNGMLIQKGDGVRQKDDNVWVIGHLHTPQKLGLTWYSGTLFQTNFGESLPKSFLHARVRNVKGLLKWKIVEIPNDPAFKLINLKIESKSDLKKIDDNPLHLYKLFIKKGVQIDYDLASKHKNLYNTPTTYSNEKELVEQQEVVELEINHSLTDGLRQELRDRGANKWQRRRAKALVADILDNLSKESLS